jgi:hypothetical protein
MASFSKIVLSGSTDGRGVLVAATASPGTTIHTASATATDYDEVWLYAQNTDTTAHKLTVEWGGTGAGDIFEITIPAESGLTLVSPGLVLKGNATPLVVSAFAATTNVVAVYGYVNQIS